MGIYIEAIILYVILFLSGGAAPAVQEIQGFSIAGALNGIFLYCLPSLALIWYLIFKAKKVKKTMLIPCKNDIISGLLTLPCLLLSGFAVTYISSVIGDTAAIPLQSPQTAPEWIILCIFCMSAAYLEESYFRYYLLSRREEMGLGPIPALIVSTAMFSVCHIYEGPWGFLNAVISAGILAFIFLRYRTLHGIAIAHGLYNIAVYVINSLV